MTYTFGAATTDRINASRTLTTPSASHFKCGWFMPTTLTAGRGYMGNGSAGNTSIRVGATTSELRIVTDHATTGAQFDTTGAAIVVDEWVFIAAWNSDGTGLSACRAWIGRADTPPVELTVTRTTAAVGANSGATSQVVGNTGTGASAAFQGEVGQCAMIIDTSAAGTVTGLLSLGAVGTITQDEADRVLREIVTPMWRGEPGLMMRTALALDLSLYQLDTRPAIVYLVSETTGNAVVGPLGPTITGTVASENRTPRRSINLWPAGMENVCSRRR